MKHFLSAYMIFYLIRF